MVTKAFFVDTSSRTNWSYSLHRLERYNLTRSNHSSVKHSVYGEIPKRNTRYEPPARALKVLLGVGGNSKLLGKRIMSSSLGPPLYYHPANPWEMNFGSPGATLGRNATTSTISQHRPSFEITAFIEDATSSPPRSLGWPWYHHPYPINLTEPPVHIWFGVHRVHLACVLLGTRGQHARANIVNKKKKMMRQNKDTSQCVETPKVSFPFYDISWWNFLLWWKGGVRK